MLFLIRGNISQWVCFSCWSFSTSVHFVNVTAEKAAFQCAQRGHVLWQLPFSHSPCPGAAQTALLSLCCSSPASPHYSWWMTSCEVQRLLPWPSRPAHPTAVPWDVGWQRLRWRLPQASDNGVLPHSNWIWKQHSVAASVVPGFQKHYHQYFSGCCLLPQAAISTPYSCVQSYLTHTLYFHWLNQSKANEAPNH